jgi:hypothetical protein
MMSFIPACQSLSHTRYSSRAWYQCKSAPTALQWLSGGRDITKYQPVSNEQSRSFAIRMVGMRTHPAWKTCSPVEVFDKTMNNSAPTSIPQQQPGEIERWV